MKRKLNITVKTVKRCVLLILLVALVGLLVYLTIDSFNKNHVSSNCTSPEEITISGDYKEYVEHHEANYPTNVKVEAVFNEEATIALNEDGINALTGKEGEFTNTDGSTLKFRYSGEQGALVYNVNIEKTGFYNILLNLHLNYQDY